MSIDTTSDNSNPAGPLNSDMKDHGANNRRIAKNTLLLYLRMIVVMAVSLYTSRLVLAALGVEDFGVYQVVGVIVTFKQVAPVNFGGYIAVFVFEG